MHHLKLIKICFSVCLEFKYAVLLLHLCLMKKNFVKLFLCVKNTVTDAKFINFNTVFLKEYHSTHLFSFKSCLKNLLGNKITNFYQKQWSLIFKMVAQRFEGWWKLSVFILVFYFQQQLPKDFLVFSSSTQRC